MNAKLFNQPFDGAFGKIIINKLHEKYNELYIFSAFAKNSGVLRLKNAIDIFHNNNDGKITAFIGVDQDGTSYEALENLYHMCDSLYVIHSENMASTYHSKIYCLNGADSCWCAVGSNNLTGGGLWTNYETAMFTEFDDIPSEIADIINRYTDPSYPCSLKVDSVKDIDRLYANGYIDFETYQIVRVRSKGKITGKVRRNKIFGSDKVSIPKLNISKKDSSTAYLKKAYKGIIESRSNTQIYPSTNERFWFEMRKSTGGSRNILDLSKTGVIQHGSVVGTQYEIPGETNKMLGGIKFFGITPDRTGTRSNITINYLGRDYYPSTILYTPNNGSWRIQLKGDPVPNDGSEKLSAYGSNGDFVDKILIFEKIRKDYYALSTVDSSFLQQIKNSSMIWALNGAGAGSKAYGML